MCNIFSGLVDYGENNCKQVWFGFTFVHHAVDRGERMSHEHLPVITKRNKNQNAREYATKRMS